MLNKAKTLKEFLVGKGFISEKEILRLIELHRNTHQRIDELAKREKVFANIALNDIIIEHLGIRLEKNANYPALENSANLVASAIAYKHRILPLSFASGVLTLGTDILLNFLVLDNFSAMLNYELDIVLIDSDTVNSGLEKIYAAAVPGEELKAPVIAGIEEISEEDEAPLIKMINTFIVEAYKARASDIHIEPMANKLRIRFRVDGMLKEISPPPRRLQNAVISRVKLMAGMNLAEKRLPQDGRIRFKLDEKDVDLRVSTLPASYGESVVLRILDRSVVTLEELGFQDADLKKYEDLIKLSNGIILVTGPTGSGKTTTLYATLSKINIPGKKLMTVEDPVEYQLSGINQMQVKPHIGLTFASSIRSMLRQAPDVIMVGEIRDYETASIAIQAALTGHLMFSTLHTNDAPSAITRLIDMGIEPYLVAATVQAVLAQRLIRVICQNCKEEYQPTLGELKMLEIDEASAENNIFYRGKGCKECNFTGYHGRIAIFELLILSDEVRNLVYQNISSSEIRKLALKSGMKTLKLDGREKVLKGITTVSEVIRVCESDIN